MARNAIAFEVVGSADPRAHEPGAYSFMLNQDGVRMGIIHACPCGCGGMSAMWFEGLADAGGPEWHVDGEWPKVTLTPSIGIGRQEAGGFHWHGFLENGEFVER